MNPGDSTPMIITRGFEGELPPPVAVKAESLDLSSLDTELANHAPIIEVCKKTSPLRASAPTAGVAEQIITLRTPAAEVETFLYPFEWAAAFSRDAFGDEAPRSPASFNPDALVVRTDDTSAVALTPDAEVRAVLLHGSDVQGALPTLDDPHQVVCASSYAEAIDAARSVDANVFLYVGPIDLTIGGGGAMLSAGVVPMDDLAATITEASPFLRMVALLGCCSWRYGSRSFVKCGVPVVLGTHFKPAGAACWHGARILLRALSSTGCVVSAYEALRFGLAEHNELLAAATGLFVRGRRTHLLTNDKTLRARIVFARDHRRRHDRVEIPGYFDEADILVGRRDQHYIEREVTCVIRDADQNDATAPHASSKQSLPRRTVHQHEDHLYQRLQERGATLGIHGPPGLGKSALLQQLMYRLCTNYLRDPMTAPLPLYVRLRDHRADEDLRLMVDRLAAAVAPRDLSDAILILDGLDEARIQRGTLHRQIEELTGTAFSSIVAGRPESTYPSRLPHFPPDESAKPEHERHTFELAPLDTSEIEQYVRAELDDEPADRLTDHIHGKPALVQLAGTPLLLWLMCDHVRNHPDFTAVPDTATTLIREAARRILLRRSRGEVDLKQCLPLIAECAFESKRRKSFTVTDAHAIVGCPALTRSLLTHTGLLRAIGDPGHPESPVEPVDERFGEWLAASHLNKLIDEHGFGFADGACDANAAACLTSTAPDQTERRETVAQFVSRMAWLPEWRNVLSFLAGEMQSPASLLEMLAGPDPIEGINPYGDDDLRHRLATGLHCCSQIRGSSSSTTKSSALYLLVSFLNWLPRDRADEGEYLRPAFSAAVRDEYPEVISCAKGMIARNAIPLGVLGAAGPLLATPPTVTCLLDTLADHLMRTDNSVARWTLEAIQHLGPKSGASVVRPLIEALRDSDLFLRGDVGRTLIAVCSESPDMFGLTYKINALLDSEDPDLVAVCCHVLAATMDGRVNERILGAACRTLQNPELFVSVGDLRQAARVITNRGAPDGFINAIIRCFVSTDNLTIARNSSLILSSMDHARAATLAAPGLLDVLCHEDTAFPKRENAAQALAGLAAHAPIDTYHALVRRLAHPPPFTTTAIMLALCGFSHVEDHASLVPIVTELLRSDRPHFQAHAARLAAHLQLRGPEIADGVAKLLDSTDLQGVGEALRYVQGVGPTSPPLLTTDRIRRIRMQWGGFLDGDLASAVASAAPQHLSPMLDDAKSYAVLQAVTDFPSPTSICLAKQNAKVLAHLRKNRLAHARWIDAGVRWRGDGPDGPWVHTVAELAQGKPPDQP